MHKSLVNFFAKYFRKAFCFSEVTKNFRAGNESICPRLFWIRSPKVLVVTRKGNAFRGWLLSGDKRDLSFRRSSLTHRQKDVCLREYPPQKQKIRRLLFRSCWHPVQLRALRFSGNVSSRKRFYWTRPSQWNFLSRHCRHSRQCPSLFWKQLCSYFSWWLAVTAMDASFTLCWWQMLFAQS